MAEPDKSTERKGQKELDANDESSSKGNGQRPCNPSGQGRGLGRGGGKGRRDGTGGGRGRGGGGYGGGRCTSKE